MIPKDTCQATKYFKLSNENSAMARPVPDMAPEA